VKRFPPPEGLARLMDGAGLEGIRWTVLAGGIIAIHSGQKAGGGEGSPPAEVAG
jgi:ubiquinone/menaquinone biosynthesis C-methylase UbiE